MKSTDTDTLWLTKPDGSSMTVTTKGYPVDVLQEFIDELEADGWEITRHSKDEKKKWDLVTFVVNHQFYVGAFAGIVLSNVLDLIFQR